MKKKNKKLIILITILILGLVGFVAFQIINSSKQYDLSLAEEKWIDTNKYNVVDVSILNEIPAISYDGVGVIYDYLDYLNSEYSIKINATSYKIDDKVETNYKLEQKDKIGNKDILVAEDNLVLITKDKKQFESVEEIKNLNIGVIKTDVDNVKKYLTDTTLTFTEFDSYDKLRQAITGEESTVNGIIISKNLIIKELVSKDLTISYNFSDLNKYIVLSLNGEEVLNSIFTKTYNEWALNNNDELYNKYLLENYFTFKGITDLEQKNLKSKSYVFGFINDGIYNTINTGKLNGINGLLLKDFNDFSKISITYKKYSNISKLLEDFNSKKVDFIFDISSTYNTDTVNSMDILERKIVVVSPNEVQNEVNSLKSLEGKKVHVVKNSYIESLLKDIDVKIISYNNTSDLIKDYTDDSIVLIDLENYNYYKTTTFKDSKIDYIYDSNNPYNFVINNIDENKQFIDLFNFYLKFYSTKTLVADNYNEVGYKNSNILIILILVIIILGIYFIFDLIYHIKDVIKIIKKNKKINLSKEDKLKYIDQLTSLKNRAYLNSKIEEWDSSEVYPQAIIIFDLNNVSYVNDNYGREEGDKIITEAANILIMNQLQNSEIIRTDGNEFLLYLVGYTEKQIISYIRKLTKQLKNISHGFGCAAGYSIITDAIKTIDDAVAEATIDMKNNKEEIDY